MSNRKASPTERCDEFDPEVARMIEEAYERCRDEFERITPELWRLADEVLCCDELEPMTPELWRLVDEAKLYWDEFEQMAPELSQLVDEMLCPHRPQQPPDSAPKRMKTAKVASR